MEKSWTQKLGGGSTIAIIATVIISVLFIGLLVYSKKDKLSKSEEEVLTFAKELGLDETKFVADFKSDLIKERVEEMRNEALDRLNNNPATPAIFIGEDKILLSAFSDFEDEIGKRLDILDQEKLPLTIEVYFDYNCSACAGLEPYTYLAEEKFGEDIEIVRKHLPFLKESSFMYAYAAEAAKEQGKFHEMSRKLFEEVMGADFSELEPVSSPVTEE
jgi:protein-disulfide isomerase